MGTIGEESGLKKLVHKLHPHRHDKDVEVVPQKAMVPSLGTEEVEPHRLTLDDGAGPHPRHKVTEGYVQSSLRSGTEELMNVLRQEQFVDVLSGVVKAQAEVGTAAAIREGLSVLGDEQGMEVVGKLVAAQAVVFAKASMEPLSRQAAREAAEEAVTGSYDAIERKVMQLVKLQSGVAKMAVPLMGAAIMMFAVPLGISLWRFALFGLH